MLGPNTSGGNPNSTQAVMCGFENASLLTLVGRFDILAHRCTGVGLYPTTSQETHMPKEFMAFLKQYGVIGLAIAVIIGGKLNTLVSATVDGILMPIVTFFIPGGAWRT
ncbi:MAG: MscL family protein, partial [Bacteroidota bacterium]